MEKKCKICSNHAKPSSNTGLCSKHFSQYERQRKTDGRSVEEFIAFNKIDVSADAGKFDVITVDNAAEQKTLWQARKEQEAALRISRDNNVRAGLLVDKAESKQAISAIMRGLTQTIENNLDAWPMEFEHKSAGEIKKIMVLKTEQMMRGCWEFLDGV